MQKVFTQISIQPTRVLYKIHFLVLPLRLLPEEVCLLLDEGLARLVTYQNLESEPSINNEKELEDYKKNLLENLKTHYRSIREQQLEIYIDEIVEGKRKKGDNRSKEEIYEEEIEKLPEINEDNMIYPVFLRATDSVRGAYYNFLTGCFKILLNFQMLKDYQRC